MTANSREQLENSRLVLVKKPVQRAGVGAVVVREGSSGTVVVMPGPVLCRVWAVAGLGPNSARDGETVTNEAPRLAAAPRSRPGVEVAFYRKYTEAMLRRYMRLSMETGRVPSLLGRELFRGHVTSYRVNSFEDAVLFCMDVERCLEKLNAAEKELIRRVALQQYSQGEAAGLMGLSLRSVIRGYGEALDRVTRMLLEKRMLEPLKSCQ